MIATSPTTPVGLSFIIATSPATPVGHSFIIATPPATPVGLSFIIPMSPTTPVGLSFIVAMSPATPVGLSYIVAMSPTTPVGRFAIIARTLDSACWAHFLRTDLRSISHAGASHHHERVGVAIGVAAHHRSPHQWTVGGLTGGWRPPRAGHGGCHSPSRTSGPSDVNRFQAATFLLRTQHPKKPNEMLQPRATASRG
jgi:hypothetical protein